jgi:hypothetical protein
MELVKAKMGASECISKGVLRNLGVVETNDEVVILKCTVIVQRNSVYVLDDDYDLEGIELSDDLEKISELNKRFNMRETI